MRNANQYFMKVRYVWRLCVHDGGQDIVTLTKLCPHAPLRRSLLNIRPHLGNRGKESPFHLSSSSSPRSLAVTDTWPPEASDRRRWFPTEEGDLRDHPRRGQVRQAVGQGLGGASRRPRPQFVSVHSIGARSCNFSCEFEFKYKHKFF